MKEPSRPESEPPANSVTLSKQEFEQMKARLEELEGLKDKLLRTAADYENTKKRLFREHEERVRFSQENLARELVILLDHFERALEHADEIKEGPSRQVILGVQLVLKQLEDIVKRLGLVRVETVGCKFDPHFHEAVAFVEGDEGEEVVEEIAPGFMMHGRLLVAAKVKVRVAPGAQSSRGGEKEEELT